MKVFRRSTGTWFIRQSTTGYATSVAYPGLKRAAIVRVAIGLAVLAMLSGSSEAAGRPYTFGTLAGRRLANLLLPSAVAVDAAGNVYVVDGGNEVIRKISAAGTVSTLAGLEGVSGSVDGTGSAARFSFLTASGVAVDAAGTVYVADTNNRTIRRITPAGVVTTLAGLATSFGGAMDGTGSLARFASPTGLAVDTAGTLYVADGYSIRKVTPAGVVTTFAGVPETSGSMDGTGSAARFQFLSCVAVDTAGTVYVADTGNYTIRAITPAGVVSTLAGSAGNLGTADGTGSAARFNWPRGIAVDGAGLIYVADTENSTIRVMTPAGVVTTLAGLAGNVGSRDGHGSAARFNVPRGVAVDGAGNVYVADALNNAVRRITPAGDVGGAIGSTDGTGSAARFNFPEGAAVDTAGIVYVADTRNHTIRTITQAGVVGTLAGLAGSAGSADGVGSVARFSSPSGVAVDALGNVYVADTGNHTIRKITPAGLVSTLAGLAGIIGSEDGPGSAGRFNTPYGVAVDSAGTVYVADGANTSIRKITPGGTVSTLAGLAGGPGTADGVGLSARFARPTSVAVDTAGNVYVADSFASTIRKITPAGAVSTLAGVGASSFVSVDGIGSAARFTSPFGVTVDASGNLYVTDGSFGYAGAIRKVTPGGTVTTVAGLATGEYFDRGSADGTGNAARFYGPHGIAVDAAGNLYVADTDNGTIRKGSVADVPPRRTVDFDGDGASDLAVFRPASLTWYTLPSSTGFTAGTAMPFGLPGDLVVPGDYDGDGKSDVAVYRPSNGTWYVQQSSTATMVTYAWGLATDLPVPGDYDGDGRADPAVYRPSMGIWYILTSSSQYDTGRPMMVGLGLGTDIPVPADYDGDGETDAAVYRPSTGMWFVRLSNNADARVLQWGLSGDVPVPGDYDGDGIADLAVYRPATSVWYIRQSTTDFATFESFQWGLSTDVAVPSDYDGDGRIDLAVFRPASGVWYIRQSTTGYATSVTFQWGLAGDIPEPNAAIAQAMTTVASRPRVSALANLMRVSDFNADGHADLTLYRPAPEIPPIPHVASSSGWFNMLVSLQPGITFVTGTEVVGFGSRPELAVPGDYDGDGRSDLALYWPEFGQWSILISTSNSLTSTLASNFKTHYQYQWGLPGDIPLPRDYDGDGRTDLAVYRPANGVWYLRKSSTSFATFAAIQWGLPGDIPVPGDYDGDGVTDLAVWRPSTGEWYVLRSSTNFTTFVTVQWGVNGDITVPGDYDGDGMTDFAVFRPSTGLWYIRQSSTSALATYAWGQGDDIPVPGDFDGDGKTDIAVWRPSTGVWFILRSNTGFTGTASISHGASGDIPILKRP